MDGRFGIVVQYNGDYYYILDSNDMDRTYQIGEMVCEAFQVVPVEIKEIIKQSPYFNERYDRDTVIDAIFAFRGILHDKYPYIAAEAAFFEILNVASIYYNGNEKEKEAWLKFMETIDNEYHYSDRVFRDTEFSTYGVSSCGQFLLTVYMAVSYRMVYFKSFFDTYVRSDEEPDERERLIDIFNHMTIEPDAQDIEYRICFYDRHFNSVYTIKSLSSLLMFEMVHMTERGVRVHVCKNCGTYFIPKGRSDTAYCDFPSPENPEKTCKEIGAQNTRAYKMKTDIATSLHRKVYMRYKMVLKRHPDNHQAKKKLDELASGKKAWLQKIEKNEASIAEYEAWLESFK